MGLMGGGRCDVHGFFPLNKKTKCLFGIDSDQPISCAISGVSRASPVDG